MTQHEKILAVMVRNKAQEWFYAPDFQRPGMHADLFVGYEASARMSELIKDYPELVQYKREGKYRYIRVRYENRAAWPLAFRQFMEDELRKVENRLI